MTQVGIQTYGNMQDAFVAAASAAAMSYGKPVTGILYSQAGRSFISSSLPVRMLLSVARRDSAGIVRIPRCPGAVTHLTRWYIGRDHDGI